MRPVTEIKDKLRGEKCVVLGAGPSLVGALLYIPHHAYIISANEHQLKYPLVKRMDMVVARVSMPSIYNWDNARPGTIRISTYKPNFTDYIVKGTDADYDKEETWSATLGLSMACYMNAYEIILMGIDIFQNPLRYYWSKKETPTMQPQQCTVEHLIEPWVKMKEAVPHPERIKAKGCHPAVEELFGTI